MPRLKDLECSIELTNPQRKLQEHMSTYGDGVVETFIAVPNNPEPFAIHLKSSAYIAEGLAMYVFIDGVYQCNRNRRGLVNRRSDTRLDRRSLVDFLVRQKEENQRGGDIIAREWRFEKLNIVSADQASKKCSPNIIENIGRIEVVVLRCKGNRDRFHNMNMDGANDIPIDDFEGDGHAGDWNYDDRSLHGQRKAFSTRSSGSTSGFAYVRPTEHSRSQPPRRRTSSYSAHPEHQRSPTAHYHGSIREASVSRQQHTRSRRSHSPGRQSSYASNIELPAGSYHYGSGPVRRGGHVESIMDQFEDRTPSQMNTKNIVDPGFLKEITERAYREGLQAAHDIVEKEQKSTAKPHVPAFDKTYQPPGSWPSTDDETAVSREKLRFVSDRHPNTQEQKKNDSWVNAGRSNTWRVSPDPGGWHSPVTRDNSPDSWETSTWDTNNDRVQDNKKTPQAKRDKFSSWGSSPAVSVRNATAASSMDRSRVHGGWNDESSNTPSEREFKPRTNSPYRHYSSKNDYCVGNTYEQWASTHDPRETNSRRRASSGIHDQTSKWNLPFQEKRPSNARSWAPPPSQAIPPGPSAGHSTSRPRSHRDTSRKPDQSLPVHRRNISPPPPYRFGLQEFFQRSAQPDKPQSWSWEDGDRSRTMPGSWHNSNDWKSDENRYDKNTSKAGGWNTGDAKDSGNNEYQDTGAWDVTNSSSWGQHHWNTRGHNDDFGNVGSNNAMTSRDKPIDPSNQQLAWDHDDMKSTRFKHNGSRHSYRRLRDGGVNPYWKFPPNPTKELYPIAEEFETSSTKVEKRYISPKEPLYQIPFSVAEKKNIEHQVRAGRGERYSHAINRPEYLDSFNKPYAVFRFKYRTREHLKNMFPGAIPDEEPKVLVEELKGMSEEEKIAEILKLNEKLEGIKNNGENGKAVTGSRAHNLTTQAPTHVKGWVQDQQQRSQGNPYAATSRSPFVQRSTQIRWGDVPNSPRATSSRRASAQELHRVRSTEAGWNGGSRDVGGFEAGWGVDGNDKGWTGGRDDNSWKDEGGGWDSGDTRPRNRKW